jgi:hypothetical protein
MNMDNVKKAILYRWMYSIFVTKETPKSEFTNKNAVTLLNQAKFNLPYDASVKPFLTATTKEFNDALKNGTIDELLDQYQIPAFLYDEHEGIENEEHNNEESKPLISLDEIKIIINKLISEDENVSSQDLYDKIKENYTLEMTFEDFDVIVDEVVTELATEPIVMEEKKAKIIIESDSEDEIDEPTNGELYTFISELFTLFDLTQLTKGKIIEEVNKEFKFEQGHREKEIRKLIKKALAEPRNTETSKEEEDVIIPDITPKKQKKQQKKDVKITQILSSEMSERRGLLRTQYWLLTNRVKTLDTLINMNVDGGNQRDEDIAARDELVEQIKAVEGELESIPNGFAEEDEAINKEEVDKAIISLDKIRAMSQRRATMKNVKDETKNNLKYIAFLSYYLISPNIIVEDATLANTYNLYPDLETKFKEVFSNLTIKQRFDFIKNLLNGRSINQIKNLIREGKPINSTSSTDVSISVTIQNFANSIKDSKLQVDEEVQYNLMYYIQKNIEYSKDVMVRNIVSDISRRTSDDDKKSIEIKVEKAIGVSEDKQAITEKVHTSQLANIKSLIRDKYPSENDEDVRDIQVMYEETRPPLRFTEMEDDLTHGIQSASLLFSLSGSSEWRSELQLIAKTFKNLAYEKEIYEVKKEMDKENFSKMGKTERKDAEYKYVEKKLKKGELSQNAAKGLLAFINMYGSVGKLPSSVSSKRMFEYRRPEDLPEHLRVDAEKELRKRMSSIMLEKNSHIKEQQNILSKIQMELTAEKIDLIAIANNINALQTSEEVKNKLLTKIQKDGKDVNVFLTYKNLSRTILINPLMYAGIQRGKRVRKMKEEMSELDRIRASFPKMNHSIQECLEQVYFKPWLNLPSSFDYYISHPQGYSKESLSDRERFLYGELIEEGEYPERFRYRPTTVFWKVYCTEFVVDVNDKYMCNMPNIKRELLNKSTRNYILGVYDKKIRSSFRELNEEDYKKECEWFEHNYLPGIRTFKNYSVIDLEINIKLGRFARDYMKKQIEEVFKLIYTGRNINIKTAGRVEKNAQKLELAIYESSKIQGKIIFYKYVFNVCKFLYLINPSSPLFGFTSFLQEVLLSGSKDNYNNIIKLSANIGNILPEIYLLDNRAEFEELIDMQVKKDTINIIKSIRETIEPGYKESISSEQLIVNLTDKIRDKLATFDHSKYKNICVNEVKDAFFTAEDNDGKMWCISRDDFYKILNNEYSATLFYPNEVVETVQSLFKVDSSSELNRIIVMQYTGDEEATKHFKTFSTFKEVFESDISDDEFHQVIQLDEFQNAIQVIETQIGKLSHEELHLYINHLIAQGYNTLLNKIKSQIYNTTYPSKLMDDLVKEYKERYGIYYDEKLMRNDRKERLQLLRSVFKSLENLFGEIDEDTKEIIVDYFHNAKIAPLVKNVKPKKYDISSAQYTPSCTICSTLVDRSKLTTTYFYKQGKKQAAHFCSTKCMGKMGDTEFEIPTKMAEVKLEALIDKLVNPIALTYDELIHRTKLIGMSLPEDIPFIQAYTSWLYNSKFDDKIWLHYNHETLDKVATHFNVRENDVQDLWNKLKNNVDFITMFHSALEKVAKPYNKFTQEVITAETFSGGCNYTKAEVEKWIIEIARHLLPADWKTHPFKNYNFDQNLFTPFFHRFNDCSQLKYSVKNYASAKRNYNFIVSIVEYIINYDIERNTQLEKNIFEKQTSQLNETIKQVSKSFKNVDTPIDVIMGMLRKEYNLQKGISLSKAVMNNRDLAHRIIHKALDIEASDSLAEVETYKNLLFKVGIQFINKYVEMMELHGLTNTVNKKKKTGRKLPEEAKIVGKLQNELYELQEELKELGDKNYELTISIKEKKGELDRSSEALKETIENELKELEASYIETRNKIMENEIVKKDVEDRLIRAEKKSGAEKADKGTKKKVFKATKKELEEKVEKEFNDASVDVITLRKSIEDTLKKLLFENILDKLPNEMNVYDIAYELKIVKGEPTDKKELRLTKKMIRGDSRKEKKGRKREEDEEEENIIDEVDAELKEENEEKEFQDVTIQQEREYEEEGNEAEFDEYASEEMGGGDDEYSY